MAVSNGCLCKTFYFLNQNPPANYESHVWKVRVWTKTSVISIKQTKNTFLSIQQTANMYTLLRFEISDYVNKAYIIAYIHHEMRKSIDARWRDFIDLSAFSKKPIYIDIHTTIDANWCLTRTLTNGRPTSLLVCLENY